MDARKESDDRIWYNMVLAPLLMYVLAGVAFGGWWGPATSMAILVGGVINFMIIAWLRLQKDPRTAGFAVVEAAILFMACFAYLLVAYPIFTGPTTGITLVLGLALVALSFAQAAAAKRVR